MALLITGSGLVGSQIARLEVEAGRTPVLMDVSPQREALAQIVDLDQVQLVQGDVLDLRQLDELLTGVEIDRIAHTVANPMLTSGALRDPRHSIELNIMGAVNVLEAARKHTVERVALCSSSVLYYYLQGGGEAADELREEAYPRPSTLYATTKQAVENLGLNYAAAFGLQVVGLRLAAVFGPWTGRGGGGPSQRMRTLIEGALQDREVSLPDLRLEYVYSKDAARGVWLACHAPQAKSLICNIGMGEVKSSSEIAAVIRQVIPSARIQITPADRQGSGPAALTQPMNLSRAGKHLSYRPQYGFEEAVTDYVSFYRSGTRSLS